jgi:hypothetical protein
MESAARARKEDSASWKTFSVSIRMRRMRGWLPAETEEVSSVERKMPRRRTPVRETRASREGRRGEKVVVVRALVVEDDPRLRSLAM